MQLFKMGGVDFTSNITMSSYKVNSTPVYEEWKDSNAYVHRDFQRNQIKGSFTLKFFEVSDYQTFITKYYSALQNDGTVSAIVYLNNKMTTSTSNFFLDFTPEDNLPIIGYKDDKGFEVTITER